jgi:hypothetical protein
LAYNRRTAFVEAGDKLGGPSLYKLSGESGGDAVAAEDAGELPHLRFGRGRCVFLKSKRLLPFSWTSRCQAPWRETGTLETRINDENENHENVNFFLSLG